MLDIQEIRRQLDDIEKEMMKLQKQKQAILDEEKKKKEVNKKERLITAEVEQNKELLFPLINNMFTNRVKAVEELNNKYNLDVTVEYGSIWKYRNLKGGGENETTGMENKTGITEFDSEDGTTE